MNPIDDSLEALGNTIDLALDLRFRFYLGSPESEREARLLRECYPRLRRESAGTD